MDTMARVKEIADERGLTLYQLTRLCSISYSTVKKTADRNGQLSLDTIERICDGLKMPMSVFFTGTGGGKW